MMPRLEALLSLRNFNLQISGLHQRLIEEDKLEVVSSNLCFYNPLGDCRV